MSFPKLTRLVQSTLKAESRSGKTTRSQAATRVWTKFEKMGGPSAFGIGRAAVTMGCMHYINNEVGRQLKSGLTEHEVTYLLPIKLPEELAEIIGRVPRWIAIEEGTDALWMYWRTATVDHWLANALLKKKKADQTMRASRFSAEVADYMDAHGIATLGQIFGEST